MSRAIPRYSTGVRCESSNNGKTEGAGTRRRPARQAGAWRHQGGVAEHRFVAHYAGLRRSRDAPEQQRGKPGSRQVPSSGARHRTRPPAQAIDRLAPPLPGRDGTRVIFDCVDVGEGAFVIHRHVPGGSRVSAHDRLRTRLRIRSA